MFKFEFPSEKRFEDYVWHHIQKYKECPITEEPVSFAYRQPALTGYGIADIIKVYVSPCELNVSVLELKNEPLKEAHLSQVAKYLSCIKDLMRPALNINSQYFYVSLVAQLAGPFQKDRSDFPFLLSCLKDIEVYDVCVSMERGFHSKPIEDGWRSTGRKISDRKRFRKDVVSEYRNALSRIQNNIAGNLEKMPWEEA